MKQTKRRDFIKKIAVGSTAIAMTGTGACATIEKKSHVMERPKNTSAEDQVNIALIGAGGMGNENVKTILRHKGVNLIGVCDLYDGRLTTAKKKYGKDLYVTKDYKDILKRNDVDAVIIGTPDFWHKRISIDALQAGKHVYCEKPIVHSIDQGHEVINAWKKSGKVMMVGAQGTSSLGNEKAKELLASGIIGDINFAEGFWARHSPGGAWQYNVPSKANAENTDWSNYVSISTKRPFDPLRFFRWRNYRDYGTGMSGDLFVHLFSSLHYITNSLGPDQISATGGLYYWKDGREVPDVMLGIFRYPEATAHPGFNLSLRCNFVDGTSGNTYLRIVGSKGSMNVEWDKVVVQTNNPTPADTFATAKSSEGSVIEKEIAMKEPIKEITYQVERGYKGAHYDHHGNWIEAIRNGGSVDQNPIFGFRAAAPALLCNDAYYGNQVINWDPKEMKLV